MVTYSKKNVKKDFEKQFSFIKNENKVGYKNDKINKSRDQQDLIEKETQEHLPCVLATAYIPRCNLSFFTVK